MTLNGVDVSHFQGAPNYDQLRTAVEFVVAKATQGTGYVDAQFTRNRAEAHRVGLIFGIYHFANAGDPTAEADFFCATVGALQPGEFVVLDWETTAPNPVAWSKTFLDRVAARTGVRPLIYLNQAGRDGFDWTSVITAGYGLWLAKYDDSVAVPAAGRWPVVAIKQYWDRGSVPGIAGQVDVDVFYGDAPALLAYCASGTPVPAPAPAPVRPTPPAPVLPAFDVRSWRAHAGDTGPIFTALQGYANRCFPGYASTPIAPTAPVYGPATTRFLAEFCRRVGIASDGRDVGPRTAAALYANGFRG